MSSPVPGARGFVPGTLYAWRRKSVDDFAFMCVSSTPSTAMMDDRWRDDFFYVVGLTYRGSWSGGTNSESSMFVCSHMFRPDYEKE